MTNTPTPPPGIGGSNGESVERRLIVVSERLERASNDLQSLVNQLRESFYTNDLTEAEEDALQQSDDDARDARENR